MLELWVYVFCEYTVQWIVYTYGNCVSVLSAEQKKRNKKNNNATKK